LPPDFPEIELDDWRAAVELLPQAAALAADADGVGIASTLLHSPAEPYLPLYT
jgi:hypothetical protein